MSPLVAKTVDSYYCPTCREGGSLIVYKKEHGTRSRSKSPLMVNITENNDNEDIVHSDVLGSTSTLDANHVSGSNSSLNAITPKDKTACIPPGTGGNDAAHNAGDHAQPLGDGSQSPVERTDGKYNQLQSKIIPTAPKSNAQSKEIQTSKTEYFSEHTQTECDNSKESTKTKLKEMEDEINNYKTTLAKKEEECSRLEKRIIFKDEQLKLINQSLAAEVDEKHRYKAKLYTEAHYIKSLENELDKLKEPSFTQTSGTQTHECEVTATNTMLLHDLRLKDESIEDLNNVIEELRIKNHTLNDTLHTYKFEAMRRMSSNKRECYQLQLESKDKQLEKSVETTMQQKEYIDYLEQKLTKITNILHHDKPEVKTKNSEKRHNALEPNCSPISSNGMTSPTSENDTRNRSPTSRSSVSSISNSSSHDESTRQSHSSFRTRSETGSPQHQRDRRTPQKHDRRALRDGDRRTQQDRDEPSPQYQDRRTPQDHDRRTLQRDDRGAVPPEAEKERELINKKKKNIIILGLPEMDSNRTARREFIQLSEFISDRRLEKWDIKKIGRIGDEREGTSRPLKIELKHLTDKIDIMRNLHRLKNYRKYENLVFQHDLTPHQLKLYSELKNEARCREIISSNFYHRVRGQPGNWKIVKVPKN